MDPPRFSFANLGMVSSQTTSDGVEGARVRLEEDFRGKVSGQPDAPTAGAGAAASLASSAGFGSGTPVSKTHFQDPSGPRRQSVM